LLIHVSIPSDNNVLKKKAAENVLKLKDLLTEAQRVRNVKLNLMPVTIGDTGSL
jgi:hypothetical protein